MNLRLKFDKIISVLMHPIFIPVYGLIIILSSNSPYGYLPLHVKKLLYLIVVINNVLLPLSLLPFLMHMNFISSWSLNEKEDRIIPLIIATILYATTSYILYRFPIPGFLKSFVFSVFLISIILTVINFKWKISLHSAGIGALLALILFLSFRMSSLLFWHFVIAAAAGGMVLSARLRLNLHSPRQVWYGLALAYTATTFFLMFFQQFI
jgi:hypothetical protein